MDFFIGISSEIFFKVQNSNFYGFSDKWKSKETRSLKVTKFLPWIKAEFWWKIANISTGFSFTNKKSSYFDSPFFNHYLIHLLGSENKIQLLISENKNHKKHLIFKGENPRSNRNKYKVSFWQVYRLWIQYITDWTKAEVLYISLNFPCSDCYSLTVLVSFKHGCCVLRYLIFEWLGIDFFIFPYAF